MWSRLTAAAMTSVFLFAALVSLAGEITPGELFAGVNAEPTELSIHAMKDSQSPDYPTATSNRSLRKRASSRALFVERLAAVVSLSSFSSLVHVSNDHRTSLKALYQHQTSLRI